MIKSHLSQMMFRKADSHKGDYGHVFVIAGSRGMTGAACLTSHAALCSGSGIVTVGIPESLNVIIETKLTEVMSLPLPETPQGTLAVKAAKKILDFSERADVCAMGPGLSLNASTARLVTGLARNIKTPLVIDADALTLLDGKVSILKKRKSATVVTPHPGEMATISGKSREYIQKNRESIAKSFSLHYNCVTILKGYRTVVSDTNGDIYVNQTGNSGMSTAGSGDVLTGMVASLIGQGIPAYSASVLAVYLHGKAGDMAAKEIGQFGMIASDILSRVPCAIKDEL